MSFSFFAETNKLKSCKMKEEWWRISEGWIRMMKDEGWTMRDDEFKGFCWLMDRLTDEQMEWELRWN